MNWIKDADGDLINLDRIDSLQVSELEEYEQGVHTHALFARISEETYVLAIGSEEHCRTHCQLIYEALDRNDQVLKP